LRRPGGRFGTQDEGSGTGDFGSVVWVREEFVSGG
jgi:hypothetical protein